MLNNFWIFIAICSLNYATALYNSNDPYVKELTPTNFDKEVLQDDAIWIIEFYAPWCGHCKNLVPDYKKAAKALKGVVKVGAVDVDTHKSFAAQYSIQSFPTIKIFGQDKKSPTDYKGARTPQGFADAGLAEIKRKIKSALGDNSDSDSGSSDVVELTNTNFDKLVLQSEDIWLVEFYAPWCGHCKNLEPHWAKAASELKGKVKLGALDATIHQSKAAEYGVKGYPTIKYFPGGKKDSNDAADYEGSRSSSDIIKWALDKFSENVPAPELLEVINEKALDKGCEGKPLCVVSVLPHILDCDAKCRNRYLDVLNEMGEKYKKKQWGWVWTEAAAQLKLEECLEIGGFGYPAMAVVNFKKMKFSVLKGSFSKDGINEFLRDISYGRGQTVPVKGATKPKIYEVTAWDGKDGQLPVEDDIDLSDVVLDEKTEL